MKSPIRMKIGEGEIDEYPSNTLFNRFNVYPSFNSIIQTIGWSNSTPFRITNIVSFSSSSCRNDASFYIQSHSIHYITSRNHIQIIHFMKKIQGCQATFCRRMTHWLNIEHRTLNHSNYQNNHSFTEETTLKLLDMTNDIKNQLFD